MNSLVRVIILVIIASSHIQGEFQNRIIGGSRTDISLCPYQLALYENDAFTCGGSLITPKCVLTAAHCVYNVEASHLEVRGGFTFRSENSGVKREVHEAFVPDLFDKDTLHMDVAILKLSEPMAGKDIQPVDLASSSVTFGSTLKVTGWGRTAHEGSPSYELRQASVQAMSKKDCTTSPRKYNAVEITNTMFCATMPGEEQDSCKGDSGGPLVADGKQYGIVSWGRRCGSEKYPGVYTDVGAPSVRKWIDKVFQRHCL